MDDSLKDSWQPKGPISKKIRERIQKAGIRFHSNDNISEFIEDGEMDLLQAEVQEKLNISPADGIFGPGTEKIVKNWQSTNMLVADGIVGPKTLKKLLG